MSKGKKPKKELPSEIIHRKFNDEWNYPVNEDESLEMRYMACIVAYLDEQHERGGGDGIRKEA